MVHASASTQPETNHFNSGASQETTKYGKSANQLSECFQNSDVIQEKRDYGYVQNCKDIKSTPANYTSNLN